MPDDIELQASADPFPPRQARVQANGASFHVIEQGEGPGVLFCHGFPDTAETWRSQMRAVAETGYRALALDMRGFGASYAPSDDGLCRLFHPTPPRLRSFGARHPAWSMWSDWRMSVIGYSTRRAIA